MGTSERARTGIGSVGRTAVDGDEDGAAGQLTASSKSCDKKAPARGDAREARRRARRRSARPGRACRRRVRRGGLPGVAHGRCASSCCHWSRMRPVFRTSGYSSSVRFAGAARRGRYEARFAIGMVEAAVDNREARRALQRRRARCGGTTRRHWPLNRLERLVLRARTTLRRGPRYQKRECRGCGSPIAPRAPRRYRAAAHSRTPPRKPMRRATSQMMHQSNFVSPGGRRNARWRLMRRSEFVHPCRPSRPTPPRATALPVRVRQRVVLRHAIGHDDEARIAQSASRTRSASGRLTTGLVGNFDGSSNPAFVGLRAAAPLLFHIVDAVRAAQPSLPEPAAVPPPKLASCGGLAAPPAICRTPIALQTSVTWFIPGKSPIRLSRVHRVADGRQPPRAGCRPARLSMRAVSAKKSSSSGHRTCGRLFASSRACLDVVRRNRPPARLMCRRAARLSSPHPLKAADLQPASGASGNRYGAAGG